MDSPPEMESPVMNKRPTQYYLELHTALGHSDPTVRKDVVTTTKLQELVRHKWQR